MRRRTESILCSRTSRDTLLENAAFCVIARGKAGSPGDGGAWHGTRPVLEIPVTRILGNGAGKFARKVTDDGPPATLQMNKSPSAALVTSGSALDPDQEFG